MKCPSCGEEIKGENKFCPNCGESLEKPKCPDCGANLSDDVTFCPNCGCNLQASKTEASQDTDFQTGASQGASSQTGASQGASSQADYSQSGLGTASQSGSSQNTNKKKSLSDIPEDFKNASTGKKILAVFLCCCIGLTLIGTVVGLIFPDLNTYNSDVYDTNDVYDAYGDALSDDSYAGSGVGDSEVQVRITYDGDWTGSMGADKMKSYSGTGNEIIDVDASASDIIGVAVQKDDTGKGELKVEIIKNGMVVKEKSTTKKYGVVSLAD